jgi:uncharacterized membrane protein YgdD (TMEM256/DUF423 family)
MTLVTESERESGSSRAGVSGRVWVALGAILGLAGVIAGAAGTHALRGTLDTADLATFETAVRFQIYHALGLLAVGILAELWKEKSLAVSGVLFCVGIVIFCGSLYLISVAGLRFFGAVAPIGGLSLMAGWAMLAWTALHRRSDNQTRREE